VPTVCPTFEQRVFADDTLTRSSAQMSSNMSTTHRTALAESARITRRHGAVYLLIPNKWSFYTREPPVHL